MYNLLDSRRAARSARFARRQRAGRNLGIRRLRRQTYAVFIIAAFLAALSGWLYAHMSRFVISPCPFDAGMGIEYLMMAMIGGQGSMIGGVLGRPSSPSQNAIRTICRSSRRASPASSEIVAFSAIFIVFLQRARRGIVPWIADQLPAQPVARTTNQRAGLSRRAAARAPLLKVEEAVRRFGGLTASTSFRSRCASGEIVGLIGPNGAGKSTMFNLLTGALQMDGGAIEFEGLPAHSCRNAKSRGRDRRTFQHVKLRPA